MTEITPRDLRDACGAFATGVTVISTATDEGDHGMTANAFMSVSLDPPLISISLDHGSKMLAKVRDSKRYAVSVLGDGMEPLAWHFAGKFDPDYSDPFDHIDGIPVVPNASAVFITDVVNEVEAGDHTLFIGKVTRIERNVSAAPLLFHGGRFAALAS